MAANATSATSRATATSNGVPVQPLLLDGQRPPDVILDYTEFDTFLDIYLYRNKDALIGDLVERVIAPAERKIEACIAAKFIDQWQKWVIFDQFSRFCLPMHVRFAPKAATVRSRS